MPATALPAAIFANASLRFWLEIFSKSALCSKFANHITSAVKSKIWRRLNGLKAVQIKSAAQPNSRGLAGQARP